MSNYEGNSIQWFPNREVQNPSVELSEGEIVTLNLHNGGHFFKLENELVSIFSGEKRIDQVIVKSELMFADHIRLNYWLKKFTH